MLHGVMPLKTLQCYAFYNLNIFDRGAKLVCVLMKISEQLMMTLQLG